MASYQRQSYLSRTGISMTNDNRYTKRVDFNYDSLQKIGHHVIIDETHLLIITTGDNHKRDCKSKQLL